MRVDDRVLAAAENNARWCDVVCRSHGVATTFEPSYWLAHQRSPMFYPDLVTMQPSADLDTAWSRLDESGGCSVKDSFADHDLVGRGFHVLFEAQWIRREPATEHRPSPASWSVVGDEGGLARWADAHAAGQGDADIVSPALLDDPDIWMLERRERNHVLAGAVANRTGSVIGVSNVFTGGEPPDEVWAQLIDVLAAMFPGLPLTGYEQGAALAAARAAGFCGIGPLRVWLRDEPTSGGASRG